MTAPLKLHIISFDIPYPPDYGGVIDVYYKIRALHEKGVRIHLHCFEYHRKKAVELEQYCVKVSYYKRRKDFLSIFSLRPFIVAGRQEKGLLRALLQDNDPILFEGLHTCGFIGDRRLKGRMLIYRESNIEHEYYFHLFRAERNLLKKLFFLSESLKLSVFQRILHHASLMLTVSEADTTYLQKKFPSKRVVYLPSFHRDEAVSSLCGRGSFVLYHGKLSVPENHRAAEYLITKIWKDDMPDLVIAGMDPPSWLVRMAGLRANVKIMANPSDDEMFALIRDAHINIMVTFQPTGLKLKLLNALYNGRFCLVNPPMISGTPLAEACIVAAGEEALRHQVTELFSREFTDPDRQNREKLLLLHYSNLKNCNLLLEMLTL